MKDTIALIERY